MASQGDSSDGVDWERLARAETHELRIAILEVLAMDGGRTLSPKELSRELRIGLSDANYHVTILVRGGLLRFAHKLQVRGTFEHFYCLANHSGNDLFERLGRET
jgi:DNA-binding MarR family transcriptional regulator